MLDYVDGHVIDDDIILIAEDGDYFDEYDRRPIAYRMAGKCWVNNHAHILKAKAGVSAEVAGQLRRRRLTEEDVLEDFAR